MTAADAKEYLSRREIPQLFESMLTGLMYHRPEDPVGYLESCLQRVRELGGPEKVQWDTFLTQERRTLPPIIGGQGKKSLFWTGDDSDMTESTGLIQEYDIFDPGQPRPKIVFVIGGPGSGKGTQSGKMATRFGFICVSVGEILRKQMLHHAPSDRKWELIAHIITNGELAPSETTIEELKQQFIQHQDARGFVVDGFPREIGQALTFEEQVGEGARVGGGGLLSRRGEEKEGEKPLFLLPSLTSFLCGRLPRPGLGWDVGMVKGVRGEPQTG
uniref:Uncharacterized protein n=1 Tax=Ornithorhynchus anatinus TaxID=9258 RepID=F6SPL9_ORNAN